MKNKLFIPRKLSDNDSRYADWNKQQPIKNGVQINQYDLNGNKTGYWEHYHDNGNIDCKGPYVNGNRNGIWEDYWDNGNLHSKGLFKNGNREGVWEWYNTKGVCINDNL